MIRFVKWLFRTFTPYVAGIAVGVIFFFLLTHYAFKPQKSPVPAVPVAKVEVVAPVVAPPPKAPPVVEEKKAVPPPVVEPAPVLAPEPPVVQAPVVAPPVQQEPTKTPDVAPPVPPPSTQPQPTQNLSPQALQWQMACKEQLVWAKRMVEDGLHQCPISGFMRQNCLDYYRGLERRYQGVSCDPNAYGMGKANP
ncbi:MAG: hypothetical protein HQL93_07615 [Magnetococcales bacterium]|nr:hypothetical protein [Magnetococcales bacterium]